MDFEEDMKNAMQLVWICLTWRVSAKKLIFMAEMEGEGREIKQNLYIMTEKNIL